MKIRIVKSHLVIALVVIGALIGVGLLAFYFSKQDSSSEGDYADILTNCEIDNSLTYYSNQQQLYSDAQYWTQHTLQPVVKKYVTEDNLNYLIGVVPDKAGNCAITKVLISGEIDVTNHYPEFDFDSVRVSKEDSTLTFDEVKTQFPIDSQINIAYLSKAPAEIDEEICNSLGTVSQFHCTVNEIENKYLDKDDFSFISSPNEGSVTKFYAISVTNSLIISDYE